MPAGKEFISKSKTGFLTSLHWFKHDNHKLMWYAPILESDIKAMTLK